jgi:transcriptional regulator with XRE-family HTH domain
MEDAEWWSRLTAEIGKAKAAGRAYREISVDAGLGVNYVSQMLSKGKMMPGAEAVRRLCKTLGVSITYLFTGADMDPEMEEMLSLLAALPPEVRAQHLEMLRVWQREIAGRQEPVADSPPAVSKR